MRYTNLYNLPDEIVKAITTDDYDHPTDEKTIPVHVLISPVKKAILESRHDDEIVEDVSDNVWRMFGSAIHYILDKQQDTPSVSEKRLTVPMDDGYRVTGKADRFDHATKELRDFKVTSTWTYIFSQKDGRKEWEEQLNMYAWLRRRGGWEVQSLKIIAILRDWQQRESSKSSDYPQTAVQEISIPLWTQEVQEEFVLQRLAQLKQAQSSSDDSIQECSPEQRWASADTFAVYRKNRKGTHHKACRVLKTNKEAEEWAIENIGHGVVGKEDWEIEERKGEDKRCNSYCSVNRWCHYYKEVNSANTGD